MWSAGSRKPKSSPACMLRLHDSNWRALSASEVAAYSWPDDTPEHKALRAAFIEGAALNAAPQS